MQKKDEHHLCISRCNCLQEKSNDDRDVVNVS